VRSALPLLPARSRWEQATGTAFEPGQWRGTIGGVGDGNAGKDVAEHEGAGGVGRAAPVDVVLDIAFDEVSGGLLC
jgi:hypothetical protein